MSFSSEEFVEFAITSGCLKLGQFVLKSGRKAPYFFNLGAIHSGVDLGRLGEFYAQAILDCVGTDFDVVFGPAYKGIPLATATVMALARDHGVNRQVSFDRKEAKTHGDAGKFLGREPRDGDRIVMVDDVITTGGTKEDALASLHQAAKVSVKALIVGMDRREKDASGQSALASFSQRLGIQARAIASVFDVLAFLEKKGECSDHVEALKGYLAEHGC